MSLPPPTPQQPLSSRKKFALLFEMFEFGVGMTRQKLKRQHPQDTTEQIEARVRKWLQSMPNTAAE